MSASPVIFPQRGLRVTQPNSEQLLISLTDVCGSVAVQELAELRFFQVQVRGKGARSSATVTIGSKPFRIHCGARSSAKRGREAVRLRERQHYFPARFPLL